MSRLRSNAWQPQGRQGDQSYELPPRFTIADRCRLMVTRFALEGDITWTEAERYS